MDKEQNQNDEGWITTGQSQSWDEEGTLIGTFVRMKTNVGAHNSNVYIIRQEDGPELGVWGSTVINGRFEEIPVGSIVKIEALGEAKSKTGTKYKDYSIMYKPPKQVILEDEMPPEFLD